MTSTQIHRDTNLKIVWLLVELTDEAIWKFLSSHHLYYSKKWATESNPLILCGLMSHLSSPLSSPRTLFQLFIRQSLLSLQETNSEIARIFKFSQWSLLAIIVFLHIYSSKYIFILYILTQEFNIMPVKFTCLHGFFLAFLFGHTRRPVGRWAWIS